MAQLIAARRLRQGMEILHDHRVVKVRNVVSGFGETLINYTDTYPIVLRDSEMVTVF